MTIITPIQKKIWKDSPTSEAISFKKANTRRIITIKPPQPNLPFFIPFTTFLFSYAINNSSIKSFHHQILRFFKFCDLIFFDSYSVYQQVGHKNPCSSYYFISMSKGSESTFSELYRELCKKVTLKPLKASETSSLHRDLSPPSKIVQKKIIYSFTVNDLFNVSIQFISLYFHNLVTHGKCHPQILHHFLFYTA